MCVRERVCVCACVCMSVYVCAHVQAGASCHVCVHIHICIHTYIYMYTHTHMYIYIMSQQRHHVTSIHMYIYGYIYTYVYVYISCPGPGLPTLSKEPNILPKPRKLIRIHEKAFGFSADALSLSVVLFQRSGHIDFFCMPPRCWPQKKQEQMPTPWELNVNRTKALSSPQGVGQNNKKSRRLMSAARRL